MSNGGEQAPVLWTRALLRLPDTMAVLKASGEQRLEHRVAAASTRRTPLSAACPWLPLARLPPPRGPICHPTPHLPLCQHQQSPPEALTDVILRSATCRRGAAPVVSPCPSFASNGFTHHRIDGVPPPSRYGTGSAPHSQFSPWATSPAGSWAGQFQPMVNRKIYSFPRNFSVNQFKVQTLKFN
jgi:hypothetical protein